MEWYIKFLPSVIESHVQVYMPKNIGQNGMIIKLLPNVMKSLVQVCLPKNVVQNGMIH